MSELSSPTSTYTTATEDSFTLVNKEEDLNLSETVIKILEKEEINGYAFLKITEEKLHNYGIPAKVTCEIQVSDKHFAHCIAEIMDAKNLICIIENKQHQISIGMAQNICQLKSSYETNKKKQKASDTLDGILQGSKLLYTIEFTEDALDEESEEYQTLHKSVRRVLGAVVGMLKDRACVDKSGAKKKA
ncbi:26894_t:CDS:2 [Dentiscutata erythropus]|uniref:26894_t:CDS:1 n=1 Tax=Dentiscutata erythropus TaxID=1348616 RepID=A0A9N9DMR7_9GLOM|nr:26894_t:CDS:2 [Dentiscutata erythropus]